MKKIIHIQCHKNCKKCFEIGNDEINKCINCIDGLEYTTGNKLGNCKNLNEINIDIDEIKQFIPIINKSDDIEIKSLLLNNNYKFEYYIPIINGELDSSMIFSQNLIPHIELTEECKNKLELNKQNIIYIGQLINYENPSNLSFIVYNDKGENIDIDKNCGNNSFYLYLPIMKTNKENSFINNLISL